MSLHKKISDIIWREQSTFDKEGIDGFLSIMIAHPDKLKKLFWLQRGFVHITPPTPRFWRTTTLASAILEASILAPIIEFFLQLVAMERFLVELIINQMKVDKWRCMQSDMMERRNLLFAVFGSNFRRATVTLLQPTGGVKTTPHKTVFAVWISTRNSRTGQKLQKVVQRQQLNRWHEVQSDIPKNVCSDLKHLVNLWALLMPMHES